MTETTVATIARSEMADVRGARYELRDVARVLRRRWKIVAVVVPAFVAAAVGITTLQRPVYAAHATLLIKPTYQNDVFNPQQDQYGAAPRRVATEANVVKSGPVSALVEKRVGANGGVSVSASADADIITITARSYDPSRAAELANAYAAAYVDIKRRQGIEDLLAASTQVRSRVDELQQQIDALDQQVQRAAPEARDAVSQSVSQRRSSLLSQQTGFRETLDQLQVRIALASGGASVVGPAAEPTEPVEPRPVRAGLLALVLGLLAGVAGAFLRDNLDDRVRGKDDLERASGGLPVLGLIPEFHRDDPVPITIAEPTALASEAYRTLRTSVQFLGLDRRMRVLLVTSPNAAEGKTTTIVNLGIALACAGVRVCLVDCDLRRPRLAATFGISPSVGFTSVLLGNTSLDRALQMSDDLGPFLKILPSGPIPPNPSELLSSTRVQTLVEALVERFDLVLVDTPPTLPVSDALVASRLSDAVLMVTTAGTTTRKGLHRALELMSNVAAPVVGTVLNRTDQGDRDEYGYGAEEYSSDLAPAEPPRRKARRERSGRAARTHEKLPVAG
jgi:capsular exopolysaccharide synthesis family protein